MKRDNVIINSMTPIYDNVGYDEVLESPLYKLKSITVEFLLKHNSAFSGRYEIDTKIPLSEEAIKDEIIEVLK